MVTLQKPFLILSILIFINIGNIDAQHLSHEQLVEDARQMIEIIESCHPDPYTNMGGKIEFHLAFHQMLKEFPKEGMSAEDFWWKISAFLANIKDGHTYLYPLKQPNPDIGAIPMQFTVMADSVLVIKRVYNEDCLKYIGCQVLKINGLKIDSLLRKISLIYPMENYFDRFRNLKIYLWYGDYFQKLFPDWNAGDPIAIELLDNKSQVKSIKVSTGKISYKAVNVNESSIELPGTKKSDFVFDWINKDESIAYIRIDKQDEFREYAEMKIDGLKEIQNPETLKGYRQQFLMYAQKWHERYYGDKGPDSLELVIEQLPSFTEFMREVVRKLKDNQTDNIIIDLRNNHGGVSIMSDILIYFLYGKEKLGELHNDSYEVTYLSPIAIETASSLKPENIRKSRVEGTAILPQSGDYDFYTMDLWKNRNKNQLWPLVPASFFESTSTFYKEYDSGEYAGFYTPKNIYVIGSDNTFSAGFETLARLVKCDAVFVGVTPAQSGNCFGMAIEPISGLKNSNIRVNVSVRKIYIFPEDKEAGYQLNPDIPMDFQTLKKYDFDENTPVLMILDKITQKNGN